MASNNAKLTARVRWIRLAVVIATLCFTAGLIRLLRPDRAATPEYVPSGQGEVRLALPSLVTLVGSFQIDLGCPVNWDGGCEVTRMLPDSDLPGIFRGSFPLMPGRHEFRVALDGDSQVTYGQDAIPGGAAIGFELPTPSDVRFYYDHRTHWVLGSAAEPIVVAAGSFQRQLGCRVDWDPGCLATWLEDPTGTGTLEFSTRALRSGDYAVKIALDESWQESYGAHGERHGEAVAFRVDAPGTNVVFRFEFVSHRLSITTSRP